MQLFQSWKESLTVFTPKNFSLFGLVSLNIAFQTFKVWLGLFWYLFVLTFFVDLFPFFSFKVGPFSSSISQIVSLLVTFILFMTLYLSLRPSTKIKNYSYFRDYSLHAGILGLLFLVKIIFFNMFSFLSSSGIDVFSLILFAPFIVTISTIFMFFYLDSQGSFKNFFASALRTLKMLWYWFPFFFVVGWGSGVLSLVIVYAFKLGFLPFVFFTNCFSFGFEFKFLWVFSKIFSILFAIVPASLSAAFYIKKVHDQPKFF
ncbi:hypothetical protein KAH94_05395 [bacterium]|nr:hypothetical protein [bacterium]